jgi:hypothetical protein
MSERLIEVLSKTKRLVADISAEERFYSRSLKIRLGVMECLLKLASNDHPQSQPRWESMEDLGAYCGNYVFMAGWDLKPASSVTCARWCKQFFLANGIFQTMAEGSGLFRVAFRSTESKPLAAAVLKQYRPRRRSIPFPKKKGETENSPPKEET